MAGRELPRRPTPGFQCAAARLFPARGAKVSRGMAGAERGRKNRRKQLRQRYGSSRSRRKMEVSAPDRREGRTFREPQRGQLV